MSSLLILEQAVLAQLQTVQELQGLKIEPYPDRPAGYIARNPRGAVLLSIAGSRYGEMINGVQQRTVRLVVTLLVRNLSGHVGAYALMDAVIGALQGWTPSNWQALAVVEERFVTQEDGVWQYDIYFDATSRIITQYNPCL